MWLLAIHRCRDTSRLHVCVLSNCKHYVKSVCDWVAVGSFVTPQPVTRLHALTPSPQTNKQPNPLKAHTHGSNDTARQVAESAATAFRQATSNSNNTSPGEAPDARLSLLPHQPATAVAPTAVVTNCHSNLPPLLLALCLGAASNLLGALVVCCWPAGTRCCTDLSKVTQAAKTLLELVQLAGVCNQDAALALLRGCVCVGVLGVFCVI